MLEAHELAEPGQERVVPLSTNNLHRRIKLILRGLGIDPWADLFQQLRRDAETDWSMDYPQ